MPIKFRCQHCRQFLGISRGKAGLVVDCPTCGRSIRVPDLDGIVKPLPQQPGLNPKDSELRNALDELANIGRPVQHSHSPVQSDGFPEVDDAELGAEPVRLAPPKPIDLPPVVPSPPVEIAMQRPLAPDEEKAWRTTRPKEAWKTLQELAENDSSHDSAPATSDDRRTASATNNSQNDHNVAPPSTRSTVPVRLFAVGVLALTFAAGFWAGRLTQSSSGNESASIENNSPKVVQQVPTAASLPPAAVRGRISYQTDAGERKPDHHARVIILPVQWSGKTKLKIDGFRVGDSTEDQRVAKASIQAMGGDFATTDNLGEYSVSLPSAGQYHVFVLSNSISRPASEDTKEIETKWSVYFERPAQLLGRIQIHTESIRYSGQTTELWDYTFPRN
jgi:hypothetical protein